MCKFQAVVCLVLPAFMSVVELQLCVSKDGKESMDIQCRMSCSLGQCPSFCLCNPGNATPSCAPLNITHGNRLKVKETVKPGTPIFSISVTGVEKWRYTLGRRGTVDGSLWASLKAYLKLIKIGRQYEIIVNSTPDLESIYQRFGIKLTTLTLELTCELPGHADKINEILLEIVPVNEYSPEFIGAPLQIKVPENIKVGTEIYHVSEHVIDEDINPVANEALKFDLWQYLPNMQDGQKYFQMKDKLTGAILVKADLDYESMKSQNKCELFLNVSASDVSGLTSYAIITVTIEDMDDLPPEFYHLSCPRVMATKSIPCQVSYEASVPLNFQGEIANIKPDAVYARDMDSLNTTVVYSLEKGVGETLDIAHKFSINKTTGRMFVLSPFVQRRKFQLVIVAREVSKIARFSRAPLYVTADDMAPLSSETAGPRSGSAVPSSTRQQSGIEFVAATIVMSIAVVLLLLLSLVLCVRLNNKSRRISAIQLSEPHDKQFDSTDQTHTRIFLKNDSQPPPIPNLFPSHDNVNKELKQKSLDTNLPNDRNQQNTACSQQSEINFSSSRICNNPVRNSSQEKHVKISRPALSSLEVEKKTSTFSNCPNTNTGHELKQQIFTLGDHLYIGNSHPQTPNALALSYFTHASTDLCLQPSVNGIEGAFSQIRKDLNVHTPLPSGTRLSTETNETFHYQTVPEVNILHLQKERRIRFDSEIRKSRTNEKGKYRQSQSMQSFKIRNRECSPQSTDNYTDQESNDDCQNEKRSSDLSSSSMLCSKSADMSLHHTEMISQLQTAPNVGQCENELVQPVAVQHSQEITQTSQKKTAVTRKENIEQHSVVNETFKNQETEKQSDASNSQHKTNHSLMTIENSHKIWTKNENSPEQNHDMVVCDLHENTALITKHTHPHTSDGTRNINETLQVAPVERPSVSAPSLRARRTKEVKKQLYLTEENVKEDAVNSSSYRQQIVNQTRPQTSGCPIYLKNMLETSALRRSSASASSCSKKRTRTRKMFDERAHHSTEKKSKLLDPEKLGVICPYKYVTQDYNTAELNPHLEIQRLPSWSLNSYLIPDKHLYHPPSGYLEQIHRPRYYIPLHNQRQHWPPEYQNVCVSEQLSKPYMLLHHQQQLQLHHVIEQEQQRQRLYRASLRPDPRCNDSNITNLENLNEMARPDTSSQEEDENNGEK